MGTPDRGAADEIVKRQSGMWTRREVVGAMGAGIAVIGRPVRGFGGTVDDFSIHFYGSFVVTKLKEHEYEVVMPLATKKPDSGRFPDNDVNVNIHHSQFASFDAHAKGKYRENSLVQLVDKRLTIVGKAVTGQPTFRNVVDMHDILPNGAELRRDSANYYSCRIRLMGGTFSSIENRDIGYWAIQKNMGQGGTICYQPAAGVAWKAGTASVEVLPPGDIGLDALNSTDHPAISIGHLPMGPEHWYDEMKLPDRNFVDHDFKWLYQMFVPAGQQDNPNPWASYGTLPAPKYVEVCGGKLLSQKRTPGSSTCFGGTW